MSFGREGRFLSRNHVFARAVEFICTVSSRDTVFACIGLGLVSGDVTIARSQGGSGFSDVVEGVTTDSILHIGVLHNDFVKFLGCSV